MYYDNNSDGHSEIENERILKMINGSPIDACTNDPEVREAFEASLRNLAEDIIEFNPGLAHVLLGMSDGSDLADYNGRN